MEILTHLNRFRNILKVKSNSKNTINTYCSCIKKFLEYFNDYSEPKAINEKMISEFLTRFNSSSTMGQYHSSIKLFYKYVIKQPCKLKYIPYPEQSEQLPKVISRQKCIELVNSTDNLKHKAILYLLYDTGIRRDELINLKIKDIDSDQMILTVRKGKGSKDRPTIINQVTIDLLRNYYKKYRPKEYLFEGQNGGKYSVTSVLKIVKNAAKKCKILVNVTPHTLRHCFATHLLDSGIDLNKIQSLLGHNNIKTTEIYCKISTNHIKNIVSPLGMSTP